MKLSNHLGNVLVTISDKKLHVTTNGTSISYYSPDVMSANDYYPFGMGIPDRVFSSGSKYWYGFNGKEQTVDINRLTAYDYITENNGVTVSTKVKTSWWRRAWNFTKREIFPRVVGGLKTAGGTAMFLEGDYYLSLE